MTSLLSRTLLRTAVGTIAASLVMAGSAENLPDMRPALVGSGPRGLANLIDTQALMRKGFQHGAAYFMCVILPSGVPERCRAYGGTPGADDLREALRAALPQARYVPAVWKHRNVESLFCGTVTFSVLNGRPHLVVYATQDKRELASGANFIDPQPISIPDRNYDSTKYPEQSWWSEEQPHSVEIEMTVSASGELKDVHAVQWGGDKRVAEYAVYNVKGGTYLPAFRNGHPVSSTTRFNYVFTPQGYYWR